MDGGRGGWISDCWLCLAWLAWIWACWEACVLIQAVGYWLPSGNMICSERKRKKVDMNGKILASLFVESLCCCCGMITKCVSDH